MTYLLGAEQLSGEGPREPKERKAFDLTMKTVSLVITSALNCPVLALPYTSTLEQKGPPSSKIGYRYAKLQRNRPVPHPRVDCINISKELKPQIGFGGGVGAGGVRVPETPTNPQR